MRIIIDDVIEIDEAEEYMLEDFKIASIFVKGNKIIEQKIDLSEEYMNDLFLTHLNELGISVILEMYDAGRYKIHCTYPNK